MEGQQGINQPKLLANRQGWHLVSTVNIVNKWCNSNMKWMKTVKKYLAWDLNPGQPDPSSRAMS